MRNLWINTRKQYESVTNSIARKGQGRNSLAESRGSASGRVKGNAPYVPTFSMTFSVMTEFTKPPGFVGIMSSEC